MTRQAIDSQRERWIAAINAGDPDAFVAVVAENVVWLPWRHDAIVGRSRLRSWLEEPFKQYRYDYSVSDVRVRTAGEWAVERARFSTRARTVAGDEAPPHDGEYTLVWRRVEGEWLIDRYIDHSGEDTV